MSNSIVFTGLSSAAEAQMRDALGGPTQRFFLLAQRILWGVSQPDLIKIDVAKTAATLLREYPNAPAGHLLAAYALRASDRKQADACVERARELADQRHPHSYLLPSDEDWQGQVPESTLECIVSDRVWRIAYFEPMPTSTLPHLNYASLFRAESGDLLMINPVPLSEVLREQVDALGPLRAFAVQGKAHNKHVSQTAQAFPDAKSFGTRPHLTHPASAHIRFDNMLCGPEGFHEEFLELPISGTELEEVVLLHKPTKTLVVQDLLSANLAAKAEKPFGSGLYSFGFGISDRIGFPAYQPMLWSGLEEFQACLRQLLDCEYMRVLGAHWGDTEGTEIEQFDLQLRWITELSNRQHKSMLLRFFYRQPTFLRDLLRYKRAQKKLGKNS